MQRQLRLGLISLFFAFTAVSISPISAQTAPTAPIVLSVYANPLPVYASPSLSAAVIDTVPPNARMTWDAVTVQQAESRNWIAVKYSGKDGWITPDSDQHMVFLSDPTQVGSGLESGAVIQALGGGLALYKSMQVDNAPIMVSEKTTLTISEGPVMTDLYTWWKASTADGSVVGWFPDVVYGLSVVKPVQAYGYNICSGFNLKQYGVLGWDSIVSDFPNLIPQNEKIMCLGSADLKGDKSPVVITLSETPETGTPGRQEVLRIFEHVEDFWHLIYEQSAFPYARTERLSLHDLTSDGKPAILWTVRNDGTGGFLNVQVLRYHPAAGVQRILFGDDLYKGTVQIYNGAITLIGATSKADEPNCCHSELSREVYKWQNGEFVKVAGGIVKNPTFLQGVPK